MPRKRNFGRGKYYPPEQPAAATKAEFVHELVSPVEHAVRQFEGFVKNWCPPALQGLNVNMFELQVGGMRAAIRRIAPVSDARQIAGHAVFKVQLDDRYDLTLRCLTPMFKDTSQAQNSLCEHKKRFPRQHFVICEIRETTITERRDWDELSRSTG